MSLSSATAPVELLPPSPGCDHSIGQKCNTVASLIRLVKVKASCCMITPVQATPNSISAGMDNVHTGGGCIFKPNFPSDPLHNVAGGRACLYPKALSSPSVYRVEEYLEVLQI